MKIRTSYSSKLEYDGEHGVFCPCGLCLFFDEKDLTPPVTIVKCPECGFEVSYTTRMRYDDASQMLQTLTRDLQAGLNGYEGD